jgi:hypothetical protein
MYVKVGGIMQFKFYRRGIGNPKQLHELPMKFIKINLGLL